MFFSAEISASQTREWRVNRVFIVGAPRSGTTLLQSMLAAHPRTVSFPETQYFVSSGGLAERRLLGWVPST